MVLGDQLDTYIIDLRNNDEFSGIESIACLVEKMIKTKKNLIFSFAIYVYQIVVTSTSCNYYIRKSFVLPCILLRVDCKIE